MTGGGGAAELAISSAVWLSRRGVPVTFIAGERKADERLAHAGVEIVRAFQDPLLDAPIRNIFNGLYNRKAAMVLRNWIQEHDTPGTVYHLHNWSQIFSPAAFPALGPITPRLVLTAHDFFLTCPNGAYADYPRGRVCELVPLGGACIRTNCDTRSYHHKLWRAARQQAVNVLRTSSTPDVGIIVLHPKMIPFLARGGIKHEKMTVLRNPVRPFTATRIAAEGNKEFVFIGRLHAGKGPDLFLKAAKSAEVPVTIIGDGPQRDELAALYPAAKFTGWISPDQIASFVSQARAVVVPSRYPEPFGLTALEAAWSGLPVVISRSAMLAQELEEVGAGVSCDPFDTPAFGEILSRLSRDHWLVRQLSIAGFRDTGELGSTPETWTDALMSIYGGVAASAKDRLQKLQT
jgi:glycosyltransferase involved in cell wall biosynthesis